MTPSKATISRAPAAPAVQMTKAAARATRPLRLNIPVALCVTLAGIMQGQSDLPVGILGWQRVNAGEPAAGLTSDEPPSPQRTGEGFQRALRGHRLLVLAVRDEVVDDGGVGQRRSVAEIAELVLGDLAQDAAHD